MKTVDEAVELVEYVQRCTELGQVRAGPYVFTFESPKRSWSARLFSMPCAGHNCLRRCSRTLPYCSEHLRSDYKVELKRTSLSDQDGERYEFFGIFAVGVPGQRIFSRGEPIMPYLGEVSQDPEWLLKRYGNQTVPYGFAHTGQLYYTDSALMRGAGASINMATPDRRNNVEFRNTLPLAMIYATESIY